VQAEAPRHTSTPDLLYLNVRKLEACEKSKLPDTAPDEAKLAEKKTALRVRAEELDACPDVQHLLNRVLICLGCHILGCHIRVLICLGCQD
jgi:hypothetical protein